MMNPTGVRRCELGGAWWAWTRSMIDTVSMDRAVPDRVGADAQHAQVRTLRILRVFGFPATHRAGRFIHFRPRQPD